MSVMDTLKRPSVGLWLLGIFWVVAGIYALSAMVSVTMASMWVLGAIILVGAVFQIVDAFRSKSWKPFVWHLLIAVLYTAAAVVMIDDPVLASSVLTVALAWVFIFIGAFRLIMAFNMRPMKAWWLLLLAGLSSVILGILILMSWPLSGLWFIGMMIGIELMLHGFGMLSLAWECSGKA